MPVHMAKSREAKRKVGAVAEISDVTPLGPLQCHLCLQTNGYPTSCEKKENFLIAPSNVTTNTKMTVKSLYKIYVKSMRKMDIIRDKELGDW